MTMNARELRHFFSLRCCTRAQWEIRQLANEMLRLCKEVAPVMFADAGPGCVRGYCPEGAKSCKRGQDNA
jgi:thymidylate synthase (FAD)